MSQRLIDKQARKQKKNGKESPTQQSTKLTGGGTICTSSSCTLAHSSTRLSIDIGVYGSAPRGFYQQDIIDWLRRITCFRRKSAKISARSLHSLAIIYVFFSSFWFSGRNKSSWTRPYHDCYEHKDKIYCTDKPCDLSTEYWGESYVSDPKIPQILARSQSV